MTHTHDFVTIKSINTAALPASLYYSSISSVRSEDQLPQIAALIKYLPLHHSKMSY